MFYLLKHNVEIFPHNLIKPDSEINEEALINLKRYFLEEDFLKSKGIVISEQEILNGVEMTKEGIYGYFDNDNDREERIQMIKDLIESYGVSEETYWSRIKFLEEKRFLTHATFKAYASDNEIEWVENEAKNLSDFVFENDENIFELNNE